MFAGSDGPRVREGVVPVQQLNECQKKLSFSSWFDCWKTRRKGVQPCDSLREMGKEGGEDGHYQQVSAKHPGSIGSILFQSPWPFQLETNKHPVFSEHGSIHGWHWQSPAPSISDVHPSGSQVPSLLEVYDFLISSRWLPASCSRYDALYTVCMCVCL